MTVNLGRNPIGITTSAVGSYVYVIEQDSASTNNLLGFSENPTTGALAPLAGVTINAGNVPSTGFVSGPNPSGILEDPAGAHLYVTEPDTGPSCHLHPSQWNPKPGRYGDDRRWAQGDGVRSHRQVSLCHGVYGECAGRIHHRPGRAAVAIDCGGERANGDGTDVRGHQRRTEQRQSDSRGLPVYLECSEQQHYGRAIESAGRQPGPGIRRAIWRQRTAQLYSDCASLSVEKLLKALGRCGMRTEKDRSARDFQQAAQVAGMKEADEFA